MSPVSLELAVLRRVLGPNVTITVKSDSGVAPNGAGSITHYEDSTVTVAELGLVLVVKTSSEEGSEPVTSRTLSAPMTVEPRPLIDALIGEGLWTSLDSSDPRSPYHRKR